MDGQRLGSGDGASIPTLIDSIVWQRFMKADKRASRGEVVVGSYIRTRHPSGAERSYSESPLQRQMTC